MLFLVNLLIYLGHADTDNPWTLLGLTGYAGEIVVNSRDGSSLFYWQFNALNGNINLNTDRRPLIIWLQGGPGCSSMSGMLGEKISPLYIDDNLVPHLNNLTWAMNFHIIAIDFPYGTGFSFATQQADYKNDSINATNYLYTFLQILGSKYSTWFARDVYIFGESYAGHWIPAIAYKILAENLSAKLTGAIPIPLKGIGLGNPLGDALYQSQYYDVFSYNLGLTNLAQQLNISDGEGQVYVNILNQNYAAATNSMDNVLSLVQNYSGNVNIYNIREYSWPDMGGYAKWLNLPATQTLLHIPSPIQWISCNEDIYDAFIADVTSGIITPMMPTLLDSIKVLIYNGQDDLIINTMGVEYWLSHIQWQYMPNFLSSRRGAWKVQGNIAGYAQAYGNMNFVQILQAGHMSPFDQPIAVRDMVQRFIFNQGWN